MPKRGADGRFIKSDKLADGSKMKELSAKQKANLPIGLQKAILKKMNS